MSAADNLAEVRSAAEAVEAADAGLRAAVADAVAAGAKKSHVAQAAGITRQTLDRWLGGDPPKGRGVGVLPSIRNGCVALLPHLPAHRVGWVLGRLDTRDAGAACRTLEYAMKAAPVQVMNRLDEAEKPVLLRALACMAEARRVHEDEGFWPERVRVR